MITLFDKVFLFELINHHGTGNTAIDVYIKHGEKWYNEHYIDLEDFLTIFVFNRFKKIWQTEKDPDAVKYRNWIVAKNELINFTVMLFTFLINDYPYLKEELRNTCKTVYKLYVKYHNKTLFR